MNHVEQLISSFPFNVLFTWYTEILIQIKNNIIIYELRPVLAMQKQWDVRAAILPRSVVRQQADNDIHTVQTHSQGHRTRHTANMEVKVVANDSHQCQHAPCNDSKKRAWNNDTNVYYYAAICEPVFTTSRLLHHTHYNVL